MAFAAFVALVAFVAADFGRLAGFADLALWARVAGAAVFRVARSFRLVVRLARPLALRVDLREGFPVSLSSRAAPPFFATRFEELRAAVDLPPAFRSVALTPGLDVSTGSSRRGLGARFGFGGFASRCVFARERSALVLMQARLPEGARLSMMRTRRRRPGGRRHDREAPSIAYSVRSAPAGPQNAPEALTG